MSLVASLLLLVPFAFGLLRLATTGNDWRYVAVALGSTLGALAAARRLTGSPTIARTFGAGAGAAVLAAATATIVDARSAVAIATVAIGFAVFSGSGAVLRARARDARTS